MVSVRQSYKPNITVVLSVIPILTPEDSRRLDAACFAAGVPAAKLVDTAAANAVAALKDVVPDHARVLVVCGNGNNGGDGFAMASMLADRCSIMIAADPDEERMTPETLHQLAEARARGLAFIAPCTSVDQVDVVIDAIIGVGGGSDLREPIPEWTRWMQALGALIVAIDVPTGLDALTGEAHADAIRAELTITMAGYKPGLLSAEGRLHCGRIQVVGIGAPEGLAESLTTSFAIERADVRAWLPHRHPSVHKYSLGHVLVVAGSSNYRGAAALTSEAALRIGAGLVTLATNDVHPLLPREVITVPLEHVEMVLPRATVVVAGPGFGSDEHRLTLLLEILGMATHLPMVIDADGLRVVSRMQSPLPNTVLTPHPGEFRRLTADLGLDHLGADAEGAAALARELGCVVHLKGVPPCSTDGAITMICASGNAALATAGTGDVLSGIIGGLMAQGLPPLRAAALGAYLHGAAADRWITQHSQESLLAGDLIRELGSVMAD
jgi:NAD(P)H-hydrate epimerase